MQLLQAALLDAPEAVKIFNTWQTTADLDHLPLSQNELLPQLYRNLERLGVTQHHWQGRLKGIYRRTWYANQVALHSLVGVLTVLQAGGVPTLVTDSVALALTAYPEPAQRPISVPEIVVPADLAEVCLLRLKAFGWQPTGPAHILPQADYRTWQPGHRFANTQGAVLQLCWHVLFAAPSAEVDTEFWSRTVPLTVENTAAQTLDPTDHLLRVCLTATGHTPIGLVDAAQLIHNNAIDWPHLLESAQKYRLGLSVAHCLSILAEALKSPIPPVVLQSLGQIPARYYERQAHHAFLTPPVQRSPVQRFWLHYTSYRRAGEYQGLPLTPISLMRYLQVAWRIRQSSK